MQVQKISMGWWSRNVSPKKCLLHFWTFHETFPEKLKTNLAENMFQGFFRRFFCRKCLEIALFRQLRRGGARPPELQMWDPHPHPVPPKSTMPLFATFIWIFPFFLPMCTHSAKLYSFIGWKHMAEPPCSLLQDELISSFMFIGPTLHIFFRIFPNLRSRMFFLTSVGQIQQQLTCCYLSTSQNFHSCWHSYWMSTVAQNASFSDIFVKNG